MRFSVTQISRATRDEDYLQRLQEDPTAHPGYFTPARSLNQIPLMGNRFHLLVDEFLKFLCSSERADSVVSHQELWQLMHDEYAGKILDEFAENGKVEAATNLSKALRHFCIRLETVRGRVKDASDWSSIFLDHEYPINGVSFENGRIEISGRLDALRVSDKGGIELVDYKLNQGVNLGSDLVQLSIYAQLLEKKHGLKLDGLLEFYEPEFLMVKAEEKDLQDIFEVRVKPILKILASNSSRPPKATVPDDDKAVDSPKSFERYQSREIEDCFSSFRLNVSVEGAQTAPQLIRYFLVPESGVKIASLNNRLEDLQVALGSTSKPLISPGVGVINLDVERDKPDTVFWKSLLKSLGKDLLSSPVSFPVGIGVNGEVISADFADSNTCHCLVAGTAGSGKSEFLKAMVATLIARNSTETLRISIVDPKILTFGSIRECPFVDRDIINDAVTALEMLESLVEEMVIRYKELASGGYENLSDAFSAGNKLFPYRVVIFDEFADLIAGNAERKRFEDCVSRIAGMGRAAGIHLVLATQRPDARVVSGLIKSNLPMKVCMRVTNGVNSRIVIDETGAECLLGKGDLLCDVGKGLQRAQSPYITQQQLRELCEK